jgi:hypothetical protein
VRLVDFTEKKLSFPLWTKQAHVLAVRQKGKIQQLNVEHN